MLRLPVAVGCVQDCARCSAVLGGLGAVRGASTAAVLRRDAEAALAVAATGGFSP